MVVVVLPTKAEIIGVQPKYQVGDTVNVTCYSYRLVTKAEQNRTFKKCKKNLDLNRSLNKKKQNKKSLLGVKPRFNIQTNNFKLDDIIL